MKNKKRKGRDKLIKTEASSLLDIPLLNIGSENDPCFGKLYDPTTSECTKCGDSEFCAIMLGQKNHLTRGQVELQQIFKDKEESEIPKKSKKEVRKLIRTKAKELAKLNNKDGITKDLIIKLLYDEFFYWGTTPEKVVKLIDGLIEDKKLILKSKKIYPCNSNS